MRGFYRAHGIRNHRQHVGRTRAPAHSWWPRWRERRDSNRISGLPAHRPRSSTLTCARFKAGVQCQCVKRFISSLRFRLVATVFVVTLPALVLLPFTDTHWLGFAVGFLALCAAWVGGERFVLRQVRALLAATRRVHDGDLNSRSGLADDRTELGQLARSFDEMTDRLAQHIQQREHAERTLAHRARQQTMVAALGQLALVTSDLQELLDHVALFVAQTLEVELGGVWEASPDGTELRLRAGTGWPDGYVGRARLPATPDTQLGHTLREGEPTSIRDLADEERFPTPELLRDQQMRSGVSVAITLQQGRYGVLSAHAARPRNYTEDEVHFMLAVAMLLTVAMERRRAEAELQKLAAFAQLNPNAALELTAEAAISYHNEAALRLAASVGCAHPREILPPDIAHIIRACLETGQSRVRHETQIAGHTLAWSFHPIAPGGIVHCYVEDVTARLSLEAQLRQAQKMETVGQLAAGVAHDFNNLLTIIQGHAGLLLTRPDLPGKLTDAAQAVYDAAERAAGLTRQLLMFSRKNLMHPRPLDLRDTVGNLSKMLQRLLGETIVLHFQSATEVPWVNADPGMIEQVLMNLAINARDAMPKGGRLTLALSAEDVDAARAAAHPAARPGRCVCLRVMDTGCGMNDVTLQHLFEPFFTTKEPGKGTGLGLATVYGIVQQHGGWVEVASEVGVGTTFNVFLPAPADLAPPAPAAESPRPPAPTQGHGERILVVEDEPMLREMVVSLLQDLQYRVVAVASGIEAQKTWEDHAAAFDLLLTDMVLPEGLSGLELATSLRARKPTLKIILTSGYGMDEVGGETLHRLQAQFLEKPYPSATLTRAIRECLGSK